MDGLKDGLTITQLRRLAWLFGLITVSVLVAVVALTEEDVVRAEVFVWLLFGCMSAVSCAACTVLVAVKAAERRLAGNLTRDEEHPQV